MNCVTLEINIRFTHGVPRKTNKINFLTAQTFNPTSFVLLVLYLVHKQIVKHNLAHGLGCHNCMLLQI
jgi:hypothetical protein